MSNRAWLIISLVGTFLLGIVWAFVVPTAPLGFQPDEGSHVAVVRFMAMNPGVLPPYQMGYDTSIHPPLYHALAALVYFIVFPLAGESGSIVAIRILSALIGTATVYTIYLVARQTRIARAVAVPAAILIALIPMRLSLSGAASNENLAALGATASLVVLYAAIRRGFTSRRILLLSFWCVVAIGSKITCIGLLPAIAVGAFLGRRTERPWWWTGVVILAPIVAVLTALGWWFVYNFVEYGDPLRKAAADRLWNDVQPGFAAISVRKGMSAGRYLISILAGGWLSFWGQFNAMQYRFPTGIYAVLLVVHLASLGGIFMRKRRPIPSRAQIAIGAATTVFIAWVLLVYIQYNWLHYTPQGRYFFVLLGPIAVFSVGGIHLFLRRFLTTAKGRQVIWIVGGGLLVLLNLYALWAMPRT